MTEAAMTGRSILEAHFWEALASHGAALAKGIPAKIADPPFIDALLKAADQYARARPGDSPAERRAALYEARTDIGGQPWRAGRMAGRT